MNDDTIRHTIDTSQRVAEQVERLHLGVVLEDVDRETGELVAAQAQLLQPRARWNSVVVCAVAFCHINSVEAGKTMP